MWTRAKLPPMVTDPTPGPTASTRALPQSVLTPLTGSAIFLVVRIEAGVHAEGAAVGVGGREGRHVVGERAALAQLQEESAAHPVAQHRAQQVQRPAIGIVAGNAGHAQAQVSLRQPPVGDAHGPRPAR